MSDYHFWPPGYDGEFCADYDVDCKKCWEQFEKESKEETQDDIN